jgi:hypothetical protein
MLPGRHLHRYLHRLGTDDLLNWRKLSARPEWGGRLDVVDRGDEHTD